MKGVDNFLEDILNENTIVHIREYALKRNCSHSEIIHFINLIKKHNENWIFFQKTESGGFFTINDEYEYQIKNFLLNGGLRLFQKETKDYYKQK